MLCRYFTYPRSRCRRSLVAGLGELEAVRAIQGDHRRVQGDTNGRSLLEGVCSLRDNPSEVGIYFNILGEAAPFLVNTATKGGCNLIANLHGDAGVRSSLYDDSCKVASKNRSRAGATPGIYGRERQWLFAPLMWMRVRFQSVGLMAIAETLTRISFSPTVGTGRSSVLTVLSAWTITARWVRGIWKLDISKADS